SILGGPDVFLEAFDRAAEGFDGERDDLVVLDVAGVELGEAGVLGDPAGPSVRSDADGDGAFGEDVDVPAGRGDEFVELQVDGAEVVADNVPVRLFAQQRQVDQVDD